MTIPGVPLAVPMNPSPNQGQVIPIAMWSREPLPTDTKYPVGFVVVIGRDPSTGTQGDLWYLSRFSAGAAVWKQFSVASGAPGIDFILTDDGAPPVEPNGSGVVSFVGDGTFIETAGQGPGSTVTIQPVAPYVLNFNVDANTGPGTDPVPPTSLGVITITGGQVAAGTTVNGIRTASLAANTFTVQAQRSSAQAASTVGANGIIHASSTDFTVDSNAFLQLNAPIPSFRAGTAGTANVTGDNTLYTIIFESEVYDTLNNYDPTTGVFTAPYAGVYLFSSYISVNNVDPANTRGFATIGGQAIYDQNMANSNVAGTFGGCGSFLIALTAGATVSCQVEVDNSTKTVGINANSTFAGCLIRRT